MGLSQLILFWGLLIILSVIQIECGLRYRTFTTVQSAFSAIAQLKFQSFHRGEKRSGIARQQVRFNGVELLDRKVHIMVKEPTYLRFKALEFRFAFVVLSF